MTARGARSGVVELAVVAALAVGGLAWVGYANPRPTSSVVTTDRLGPDNGEPVAEYLTRAADSLDDPAAPVDAPRWASVSLSAPTSPEQAYTAASDVRISQVLIRVPIDRVQTPVLTVGVVGSARSVANSGRVAASGTASAASSAGESPVLSEDRQDRIQAVSQRRLLDGCACVVALVVRGTPGELESLSRREGVRAVEALPPDAVSGKFAVSVLLPEHTDIVGPLPDDGPVPPA